MAGNFGRDLPRSLLHVYLSYDLIIQKINLRVPYALLIVFVYFITILYPQLMQPECLQILW